MSADLPLTLRDLYRARQRVAGVAVRTPLAPSAALSARTGRNVFLKLETQQVTGAFKSATASRLLSLSPDERSRGWSHGYGQPRACRGVMAARVRVYVVCRARSGAAHKVAAMRGGAEVVVHGANQDGAEAHARGTRLEGEVNVSPFDDLRHRRSRHHRLEIWRIAPGSTRWSCLSGGGLIGGIAFALKAADPGIRTVGVSMARAGHGGECQGGKRAPVARGTDPDR
ncbi:MAG: pyridoxal-phosphate dependent enzyme [Caldilineaceae bacterium]